MSRRNCWLGLVQREKIRRQMLALVQLRRQVAPPDREVQRPARGAALIARAAMPDVAVDDRHRTGLAGQPQLLWMGSVRIFGNLGRVLGRATTRSSSPILLSGTLIGVHLCEPGTTRVGPLVGVISSSMIIELTTRQSFGVTRGTSLCSGCCPSPLSGLRAFERIDPDFAEEMGGGGKRRLARQAPVEGRRLVEQVGEPRRARFDMHFVPAEVAFNRPETVEFGAHFLDFRRGEDIFDDEISLLVEFASLFRREIAGRDAELGESCFGVHLTKNLPLIVLRSFRRSDRKRNAQSEAQVLVV